MVGETSKELEKLAKKTLLLAAFIPSPFIFFAFILKLNPLIVGPLGIIFFFLFIMLVILPLYYIDKKLKDLAGIKTFDVLKYSPPTQKTFRVLTAIISVVLFFVLLYFFDYFVAIVFVIIMNVAFYFYNKRRIKEDFPQEKSTAWVDITSVYNRNLKNFRYLLLIAIAWIIQILLILLINPDYAALLF